jgi:hypothetical protein
MKNSEIEVRPTSGAGPRGSEGSRRDTVSAAIPNAKKIEASLSTATPRNFSAKAKSKGHAETLRYRRRRSLRDPR